ncbi:MAG: hypothetical protein RIS22_958, partial [Actinomycetota bacterium]
MARAKKTGNSPARSGKGSRGAIGKIWLAIASAIGGAIRFLLKGAKELDPAHRRDGLGLFIIILSLIS